MPKNETSNISADQQAAISISKYFELSRQSAIVTDKNELMKINIDLANLKLFIQDRLGL